MMRMKLLLFLVISVALWIFFPEEALRLYGLYLILCAATAAVKTF